MQKRFLNRIDTLYFGVIVLILVGMPVLIWGYNRSHWKSQNPRVTQAYTLTGNTAQGWILGDVPAYEVALEGFEDKRVHHPVIYAHKGDRVLLLLKSSDVVHGFSMQEAGIFVKDGIHPGTVTVVTFDADKEGTFSFSCNAICGDNHENMQGSIVVTA